MSAKIVKRSGESIAAEVVRIGIRTSSKPGETIMTVLNHYQKWRHPFSPEDDAPRAEHEAYAKNPRAFGYTHWIGTDGKRYDLPNDFAYYWLPCRHCGRMIGGHEAHREYRGDPFHATDDYYCVTLPD